MDVMTGFLRCGGEDCFRETSAACRDGERARIGERHGIRVVPG